MQKIIKILMCMVLALVFVSCVVPTAGASGPEQGQMPEQGQDPEQTPEQSPGQEQEHVHEWGSLSGSAGGHRYRCKTCGERSTAEAHTFDGGEICTICGYDAHVHNFQCVMADSYWHRMACSGCGEAKTTSHSFNSSNCCTVCGYEKHQHIWQFNGEIFAYNHGLGCTMCDSRSTENHSYGDTGACTVCGATAPHEHQWAWNGRQYGEYSHVLGCNCGETMTEDHKWRWDGVFRNNDFHGLVCTVCGKTRNNGHMYDIFFVSGQKCVICGYETVKHTWHYNNEFAAEGHEMLCSHCNVCILESHVVNAAGKCTVCGYSVYDPTVTPMPEPAIPKPTITAAPEIETGTPLPEENESEETDQNEIDPVETFPVESDVLETDQIEMEPIETKPIETDPLDVKAAVTEIEPENAEKEDAQRDSTARKWIAVVEATVLVLAAAVLILKKKLSGRD